jgi:cellulose synthase/poly-beta-1,6-N-acetylglucosamine synthase-like glycosyltransferase
MEKSSGKSEQINRALDILTQEFIIFTDADSTLDPSCFKELILELKNDPQTAILGALIIPKSRLAEEQIHWQFLNYVWWLEGEALSSAGLSGVCYAARRESLSLIPKNSIADDMYLALNTSYKGYRVRICRKARAYELRVPQSSDQMIQLRRWRGKNYLDELQRINSTNKVPLRKKAARWIRLWHFTVSPKLVVLLFLLGVPLLFFNQWSTVLFAFLIFLLSSAAVLYSIHKNIGNGLGWMKLVFASFRLFFVTLLSMLTLKKDKQHRFQSN